MTSHRKLALGGMFVLAVFCFFVAPTIKADKLGDSIDKLNIKIDQLKAERAAYKAVAQADGWTVNVYQKAGIWWVRASNQDYPTFNEILYDDDRAKARSAKK